jgi:general secretion pathway protein F
MGKYRYHALDSEGVAVAGEIEASDRREAASRLRASGIYPVDLDTSGRAGASTNGRVAQGPRLSRGQIAVLTRQLADLASSGMPLHRCLDILREQAGGRQRQLLESVSQEVQRGAPLSEVLRPLSRSFSTLYVEMIRAGESSGHLDAVLMRLAEYLEAQEVRRAQIISAFTYPAVIVAATPAGGTLFDAMVLHLPLIGRLVANVTIARFARTLGTLLAGGVPMLGALEIAAATSANRVIGAQANTIQQRAREGESISKAMADCRAFPSALVHMAAVGEETGNLPAMLTRYADAADFQFDQAMRRLTSLVEPAIILVMGGIVAFIVLSVLLPVFEIYSAVNVSGGAP